MRHRKRGDVHLEDALHVPEQRVENGIIFSCMDGRFKHVKRSMEDDHFEYAFTPSLAGGALAFVLKEDQAAALKQVKLAAGLTQEKGIMRPPLLLVSHMGCGAYRAAGFHFRSRREEVMIMWQHLDEAARNIEEVVPAVIVAAVLTEIVDERCVLVPAPELQPV